MSTGMLPVLGLDLMASHISKPFMLGMSTSEMMRSNCPARSLASGQSLGPVLGLRDNGPKALELFQERLTDGYAVVDDEDAGVSHETAIVCFYIFAIIPNKTQGLNNGFQ